MDGKEEFYSARSLISVLIARNGNAHTRGMVLKDICRIVSNRGIQGEEG